MTRPLLGRTEPRIFTPPRGRLTRGRSYGYAVVDFARDVLREPLDPWEEWLVVHAGELLPDGRPRFRQVLVLVARQNGKTHVLKVLSLFWLFVEQWPLVLSMSTNLDYAREAWQAGVETAQDVAEVAAQIRAVRFANGEQQMSTVHGTRWKIAASNRRGGRSLSVDRLVLDELREHADFTAWNAAVPTMNARPRAQAFAISNQGDDSSVVLDSLRTAALEHIETGEGDDRLGLFEWSAEDGCDLLDRRAWAQANPNMNIRINEEVIEGMALRAAAAGGEEEAGFRTEMLCQRVRNLAPAVDPVAWQRCIHEGTLDGLRKRSALCLDVAPDGQHATLVAAATVDGKVRIEVVQAWDDLDELRRDLPGILQRARPRSLGWFPQGPAAALAADLRAKMPAGVEVEGIKGDSTAVCMGFDEQVRALRVQHQDDPLLNAHVGGAERLRRGDAWVFSRRGGGHCDAAYAAAGAVHLARLLPAVGKPRLLVAG